MEMEKEYGFSEAQRERVLAEAKLADANFDEASYYDPDGDCVECLLSPGRFYAKRADNWMTAYYAYGSDELVGAQIKGITRLLSQYPGLEAVEIHDGRVGLSVLIQASAWSSRRDTEDPVTLVYKDLIRTAAERDARVELVGVS